MRMDRRENVHERLPTHVRTDRLSAGNGHGEYQPVLKRGIEAVVDGANERCRGRFGWHDKMNARQRAHRAEGIRILLDFMHTMRACFRHATNVSGLLATSREAHSG